MKYTTYDDLLSDLRNFSQDEDAAPCSIVLHLMLFPCDKCFGDGVVGNGRGDEEPCAYCRGAGVGIDGAEITETYDALGEACRLALIEMGRITGDLGFEPGRFRERMAVVHALEAALAKAQEVAS